AAYHHQLVPSGVDLAPWPAWGGGDFLDMPVLLRSKGKNRGSHWCRRKRLVGRRRTGSRPWASNRHAGTIASANTARCRALARTCSAAADFAERVARGWGWEEVLPYFKKVERDI